MQGATQTGVSVALAQRLVLAAAEALPAETRATSQALGRVLAEPVAARRSHPPADCSAMDGYAVCAGDLARAREGAPVRLRVVYEVAAGGQGARPLAAGEAARIFTGAPVPPGSDTVVRQEDTFAGDGWVEIARPVPPGDHVRLVGEDVREGQVVLEAGCVLGPAQLGMLASLGRTLVRVHQRPRVAILSGGDELVEPDGHPSGGKIVSSNVYALAAQCLEVGAQALNLGLARDTPESLEGLLRAGLSADLLVSSAGVSVGEHDHVRPVLEKLGCRLVFFGVRMKPGFPLAFGRFEGRGPLVFGLPGNPVSAMVTFEQFVRPVIRRMAGHRKLFRPEIRAVLGETLEKSPGRLHFVRVTLSHEEDRIVARTTGSQSSGVLSSMVRAHGLVVFPEEAAALREGETVRVQLLDPDFLAREEPSP